MSIGERILEALEQAGKTQADLARHLSTRTSTVTGWVKEGRVPSATSIAPICEFTGVSLEWLLKGDSASASAAPSLSPEAIRIAERWSALDEDGRMVVGGVLIQEERRMTETKREPDRKSSVG